jgi:NAD(P)-dependent dehydrogenase (short-subunit alcohol dehydrogenase family)
MDLELSGKKALITGGSRGIGKAIALELAKEGADIAIAARNQDTLAATGRELAAIMGSPTAFPRSFGPGRSARRYEMSHEGRKLITVQADTTSDEDVQSLVAITAEELGGIDILVNNAAAPGGLVGGGLEYVDTDDLLADIDTKVVGYLRCAKAAAPYMQRAGWGRIIIIGGLAARNSGTYSGLRNLSLVHMTKTMSTELGQYGITVNTIHPGTTITERSAPMYERQAQRQGVTREEIEAQVASGIAVGRIIDASEVAYVAAFIASPKAGSITGEAIAAGGGVGVAVHQ